MRTSRIAASTFAALAMTLAAPALAQVAPPAGQAPQPVAPPPGSAGPAQADMLNPARPYPLMVGDRAPDSPFTQTLLGELPAAWEPGNVYVIYPFALFCDPCLAMLPTLTKLQNELGDQGLVVIGVTSPAQAHTLEQVNKYIFETARDDVGFVVAWDRPRAFFDTYLNPTGRSRIPVAFVIDRAGVLAYIGGNEMLESSIRKIVAGTYDLEDAMRRNLEGIHASWDVNAFEAALREGDYPKAYGIGRRVVFETAPNDFAANSNIAWAIVDPAANIPQMDLDLALAAAQRAVVLSESRDALALDTLARVQFLRGAPEQALENQKKALAVLTIEAHRQGMQNALKQYEAAVVARQRSLPPSSNKPQP